VALAGISRTTMNRRFALWSLFAAVALAASLAAHALQLALENGHLFGGIRSAYSHPAQGPMALAALVLAVFAASLVVRRVLAARGGRRADADWLLPALADVRALGLARCFAIIVGVQLSAFAAGELVEQATFSYRQFGFAAFAGSGHASAALVQFAIGLVAAVVLWFFAREICRHARALAEFAGIVASWLARPARVRVAPALRSISLGAATPQPPLLSRRIANRPPPASTLSFA